MSTTIRRLSYSTNGITAAAAAATSRGQIVCYDTVAFCIVLFFAISFNLCTAALKPRHLLKFDPGLGIM